MEYLITGGYYIVCLIIGLAPPAAWMIIRLKSKSPLWPILLLHMSLLVWFLLAKSDRFNTKGYGDLASLFLFTPYFAAYALGLVLLSLATVRPKGLLCLAIIGISLATGAIAFEANEQFDWRLPRRRSYGHYLPETPLMSATISGGLILVLGLFLAVRRKEENAARSQ